MTSQDQLAVSVSLTRDEAIKLYDLNAQSIRLGVWIVQWRDLALLY